MKSKLSLVLLLIAIVLIDWSAAKDSAKSREKRSPKPQFGKLIGSFIAKWAAQAAKKAPTVVKLVRKTAQTVANFVSKNPGTSVAAATGGAAVVGVGGLGLGAQLGKKQCKVHINRNLPELQPVFINDGIPRKLMLPKDGYLTWAFGETSYIACPPSAGSQNYINATSRIVGTITCDDGLMFLFNGRVVNINTITCARRVTGNQQLRPDPQCVGTNKAIGFNVPFPTGDVFLDLFYSCIDETRASTLFTHHVLFGNEIEHKCIYTRGRPDFKSSGFTDGVSVSAAYNQDSQKARLTNLFSVQIGPNYTQTDAQTDAQHYIYDHSYLQRGHLTPDGDELFTTWQWSTYFYINVAGMWESINIGNWKNLETKVRTLASETGENLEIYTGTYGTLSLCSPTNTSYCPNFTLVNGGIPAPKWLWKIVKAPSKDAAIALVVSNNPFEHVNPICGSSQNVYGWHQNGFDNFRIGEVSYCKVQDLQNVVGYIPQAALARDVLAFQ